MDYHLIVGVTGLAMSFLASYKVMPRPFTKRKEKLRSDYEFAEKIMTDNRWRENHDYLLERGYWGLSGTLLDASIIRFFMLQKYPVKQLTDYGNGQRFLDVEMKKGSVVSVKFKKLLDSPRKFMVIKLALAIPYFFCAMMTFVPVVFLSKFIEMGGAGISLSVSILSIFGTLTYFLVETIWALHSAKRVVEKVVSSPSSQSDNDS